MNLWHDARDWLGGYPYEAATPDEVERAMAGHGLVAVRSRTTATLGCSEFLHRRA